MTAFTRQNARVVVVVVEMLFVVRDVVLRVEIVDLSVLIAY